MPNFNLSRICTQGLLPLRRSLAWGPLCALVACSVYDDSMQGGGGAASGGSAGSTAGSASQGGAGSGGQHSAGSSGSGGASGSQASGGGGQAGTTAGSHSGGSGGTAGAATAGAAGDAPSGEGGEPAATDEALVDDMEDGDAQVKIAQGRTGFWYVGNDGTASGVQEPSSSAFQMAELAELERPNSRYAARMLASGFTGWGTVIGFNLVQSLGKVEPYDASQYCGVSFWAKAKAATPLRYRLPDASTHQAGGVCVVGGGAGQDCYDHFGKSVALTTTWQQFSAKFTEFAQTGTGYHPPDKKLKVDALFAMEWALPGSVPAYEIWIDDVAFTTCP